MLYNIVIVSIGLFISLLLFYRFPTLKNRDLSCSPINIPSYKVSIIIPARNEEENIALLLEDLKHQTYPIYEVICVDDDSIDNTYQVIMDFGVKGIKILEKPEDWIGKSYACQKGADLATGELYLFIDADVRLSPTAISNLVSSYEKYHCTISVQPYHQMLHNYEQFSLFFNLIQIAANGTSMIIKGIHVGLYGPIILLDKNTYRDIGGHSLIKRSIVDDLALGESLRKKGYPFKVFLGGDSISFRMYGKGITELMKGWTKNYAIGARKTPPTLIVMVFLWVTSCTAAFIGIVNSIFTQNLPYLFISLLFYLLWIIELFRITGYVGNFKKLTLLLFPIPLAFFLWVILYSSYKKLFSRDVVWKDRKIKLEK